MYSALGMTKPTLVLSFCITVSSIKVIIASLESPWVLPLACLFIFLEIPFVVAANGLNFENNEIFLILAFSQAPSLHLIVHLE
jgi:hypothetical protein